MKRKLVVIAAGLGISLGLLASASGSSVLATHYYGVQPAHSVLATHYYG